jgi:lysophospholipase L1-like esterase
VTVTGASATLLLGIQVLFVGDSITAGVAADPGLGFVERIAADHSEWEVINAGCPGASSLDWTLPKPPDAPDHCAFRGAFELLAEPYVDAEVVHILLGTNDSTGFFESEPVGPDEYASNIETLALRFAGDVFVSIPPPFPDPDDIAQARLDLYALELILLAASPNAPFRLGADFSLLDRAALDGVHPTNDGHAWMADQLNALLVPEPGTVGMLLVGLCWLAVRSRREPGGLLRGD